DELRENREDNQTISESPWKSVSFLHPKLKAQERHAVDQDGLFLENAVQLSEDHCLVYLTNSTHTVANGWYRFGGEGHLVELESYPLSKDHKINRLLRSKIDRACALITPGVWGSNRFSYRYPQHSNFPHQNLKLLTDKPVPYRYRVGQPRKDEDGSDANERYMPDKTGRLGRGRYAIPSGSVYVFEQPLNLTWWDFPDEWFPKEGFYLKRLGCGLCLPINVQGVPQCTTKPME
ncbi:MAG: type III-B CRISPR module-associated Cmr3 family protein, partial [Cyanobacteriota bacterium]